MGCTDPTAFLLSSLPTERPNWGTVDAVVVGATREPNYSKVTREVLMVCRLAVVAIVVDEPDRVQPVFWKIVADSESCAQLRLPDRRPSVRAYEFYD
jgi:hypothetical protein